jgi:hypothetical protein
MMAGGFINNPQPKAIMQFNHRATGLGILALVALFVLYYIWPYLVGFLAIVGAVQIYQVWRKHHGR